MKLFKSRLSKLDLPPGSLVPLGVENRPTRIFLTHYDEMRLTSLEVGDVETCEPYLNDRTRITWLDIEGLSDTQSVDQVGRFFEINPVWLEDVLNTDHRPKAEYLEDMVFAILRSATIDESSPDRVRFEQVSIFLGDTFVITFREGPSKIFESVRKRIDRGLGRVRRRSADYLFYSLIDSIADKYFLVLDDLSKSIESLEHNIHKGSGPEVPNQIQALNTRSLALRRAAIPFRDTVAKLCGSRRNEIRADNIVYFQDAYESMLEVVEQIGHSREMLISLQQLYANNVSQKLNEIIKFLTVFSSIFIPLTYIVGIYGMNFPNMPEVHWEWGYTAIWAVMASVAGGLLGFFRLRRWI
jgi:magnesium transporter